MEEFKYILKSFKNFLFPTYYSEDNIVLHKDKIIYFPIPKNGCSTIKTILYAKLYKDGIIGNEKGYKKYQGKKSPHRENFPFVKKQEILDKYKNYFRFAIVRNPWDRVVSLYTSKILFDKTLNKRPYIPTKIKDYNFESNIISKMNRKENKNLINRIYIQKDNVYLLKNNVTSSDVSKLLAIIQKLGYTKGIAKIFLKYKNKFYAGMSFEEFVESINSIPPKYADNHFKPQYNFLQNNNGKLLTNYIGKFNRFRKENNFLLSKLKFNINIPHKQKSNHQLYVNYYNNKTKELVKKYYNKDLKLGNFSFGS